MEKDIAIIGMAGRFPLARDMQQLYNLLAQGKDGVGQISAGRIKSTTLDPHRECMIAGYLEDIDVFDYRLFNISAGEAETMDPHLRLLLEVAYETFEDAAYAVDDVRGTRTAVFVADAALEYYKLADTFVPTLASGNTKAFLAAMLSRQFDLRGNSLTVDTTCSSSLLAVHLACNELILGDADMALAGAGNIYLFPYREETGLNLDAPDGRSKAFSAQANGMSHGEAVACVLLKRLDRAIADGDIIHAVIKGSAVNSNAGRSASITAPDSEAQADVIRTAWRKAGIDPRRIGFIEAHGSGTVLGDNIEVGGFTLAFNTYTDDKAFCPISTIKSNIGHTRAAAGMSGLIKMILSLKHKILFPNIHFTVPHPQIAFHRSAVFVNAELQSWASPYGPRYGGVSSIGLSGTNCHMILEEAPQKDLQDSISFGKGYLLPVSSQTKEGLKENAAALLEYLSVINASLADISYTLWCGRKHYDHRMAITASSIEEAKRNIGHWLAYEQEHHCTPMSSQKLVFIFDEGDNTLEHYQFQYDFYKWLDERGVNTREIMAANGGKMLVEAIRSGTDMLSVWEKITSIEILQQDDLEDRVSAWLQRETVSERVMLVYMGKARGMLSAELERQAAENVHCTFVSISVDKTGDAPMLKVLKVLYEQHADANWKKVGDSINGNRIALPTYRFRKLRCWIREDLPQITGNEIYQEEITGVPAVIRRHWDTILNIKNSHLHDNFFELGGDSIKATRVINGLNAELGLRLDFEDLFDYPTIAGLAGYLDKVCSTPQKMFRIWKEVLKQDDLAYNDNFFEIGGHSLIANQIINRIKREFNEELNFEDFFLHPTINLLSDHLDSLQRKELAVLQPIKKLPQQAYYDVSHAQKRLWILGQSPEGMIAYNQPGLYKIQTELDIPTLERAFSALIARHEILRTTFVLKEDKLLQEVHPPEMSGFYLKYLDFRGREDAEGAAVAYANEQAGKQFNMETGPLMDVLVIQTGNPFYIVLLNLHHIITDGWSNGVMIYDLLTYYRVFKEEGKDPLPALRIQYRDYAAWQNQQMHNNTFMNARKFWMQQFGEQADPLRFPADHPRPATKAYRGRIAEFSMEEDLAKIIKESARQHNATLFMVLLAGLYALLYRFSGQSDITVGTTVANRDHIDLEDQMGFYVNALAIRTRFDSSMRFSQLLDIVKKNTLKAFEYGTYPFDLLIDDLRLERDPGRSPLFDIMLTLQNMDNDRRYNNSMMQELNVESIEPDIHISKFDLLICITENEGRLDVFLEYDTALLSETSIGTIKNGFVTIFSHLPEDMSISNLAAAMEPPSSREEAIYNDFVKAIQDI